MLAFKWNRSPNGIAAHKIIEVCKKYYVKSLTLSLDGILETNKKIRGVDYFSNIIRIIEELNDSNTHIGISYTICPENNNLKDFIFVKKICERYDLGLNVNIYGTPFYFESDNKQFTVNGDIIKDVSDKYVKKYVEFYNYYIDGKYAIPCLSIMKQATIWPNGNISLCQQKDIIMGNLYNNSLSQIWKDTKKTRKEYMKCNDCWLSCHRVFDIQFIENKGILRHLLNEHLLNEVLKWHWVQYIQSI